jgi:cell division protease FtsH
MGGGHDEREQTLNQLLVEMDGFDVKGGVILIAATNRPDILDPRCCGPAASTARSPSSGPTSRAGTRSCRCTRRASRSRLRSTCARSPGARPASPGADLANVLNEAALLTARLDRKLIDPESMDEAIDRVIAGPQKRTRIMSDKRKKITAYHEGGHALVAAALPNTDRCTRSRSSRGGGRWATRWCCPTRRSTHDAQRDARPARLHARRSLRPRSSCSTTRRPAPANDIEKATGVARAMVTQYGMTERIGAIKLGSDNNEPFLGRDMGHSRDYSEEVASLVDEEVRKLIEAAHEEAWEILVDNREILDNLVLELLERETLDKARWPRCSRQVRKRPPRPAVDRLGEASPVARAGADGEGDRARGQRPVRQRRAEVPRRPGPDRRAPSPLPTPTDG